MKIKNTMAEVNAEADRKTAEKRSHFLVFEEDEWRPVEVVLCEDIIHTLNRNLKAPSLLLSFPPTSIKVMIRALERLRADNIAAIAAQQSDDGGTR